MSDVILKEGLLAIRGHFLWRDRYVVLKKGNLAIFRKKGWSLKANIHFHDAPMKITFHDEQAIVTISVHGKDTVMMCKTSSERDEWLSALYSAQEGQDLQKSSMRDFSLGSDDEEVTAEEDDLETLRVFQGIRSSLLYPQLDGQADSDLISPCGSSYISDSSLGMTDEISNEELIIVSKNMNAIANFIESNIVGGRAILLHLDFLKSANIDLLAIMKMLAHRTNQSNLNDTISRRKSLNKKKMVTEFVRTLIFHPHYSKRMGNDPELNGIIDKSFSHCRLRHFSKERNSEYYPPDLHEPAARIHWGICQPVVFRTTSTDVANSRRKSNKETKTSSSKKKRNSFPTLNMSSVMPLAMKPQIKLNETLQQKNRNSGSGSEDDYPSCHKGSMDFNIIQENEFDSLRSLLWKFSPLTLAEQATLSHQRCLAKYKPWDFLQSGTSHTIRPGQQISKSFNALVTYLVWSVIIEDTPKERAEVIEQITTIALASCKPELQNFHLLMACIGCLGDIPLMRSRLPLTWKKVRAKYKNHLKQLRLLCDHAGGYEELRKQQKQAAKSAPCVPYIGLVGSELERLSSLSYVNKKDGLINLSKLEIQYEALAVVEQCAEKEHIIDEIKRIQSFLTDLPSRMKYFSNRLLLQRSQMLHASEFSIMSSKLLSSDNLHAPPIVVATNEYDSAHLCTILDVPVLSFRSVCNLLATVKCIFSRVVIFLEAIFADDRINHTIVLRKFWLDVKQNIGLANMFVVLTGIRKCIGDLAIAIIDQRSFELKLLIDAEELANLVPYIYERISRIANYPVANWALAKVRKAMRSKDIKFCEILKDEIEINPFPQDEEFLIGGVTVLFNQFEEVVVAMDLLLLLYKVEMILHEKNNISDMYITALKISTLTHPCTILHYVKNVVDLSKVRKELQKSFQLYESIINRLQSKRGILTRHALYTFYPKWVKETRHEHFINYGSE